MLLKAFKVVTRGVRFLDAWNEEVGLSRMIAAIDFPPTPSATMTDGVWTPVSPSFPESASTATSPPTTSHSADGAPSHGSPSLQRQASTTETTHAGDRCSSVQTIKRNSTSHRISNRISNRISSSGQPGAVRNPNLASERLNAAYDSFLGVLGSFIGLHMHPRSSIELAATTQLSVRSCRTLFVVVQAIADQSQSEMLKEARKSMFERLAVLVQAAEEAFRPNKSNNNNTFEDDDDDNNDDMTFTRDTGNRLVVAATDCVRSAGNCLAKARQALEEVGDFEMDPISPLEATENDDLASAAAACAAAVASPSPSQLSFEQNRPLPPPPLGASSGTMSPRLPPPTEEAVSQTGDIIDQQPERNGEKDIHLLKEQDRQREQEEEEKEHRQGGKEEGKQDPAHEQEHLHEEEQLPTQEAELVEEPESIEDKRPGEELGSAGEESRGVEQSLASSSFSSLPVDEGDRNAAAVEKESSLRQQAESTGSLDTDDSSPRSPTSTRATTPDQSDHHRRELKNSASQSTLDEDSETEANVLQKTYAHELIWRDGNIVGGSFRALVEKLTAHESTPDAMYVSAFALTFRLFATPLQLARALVDRFDYIGDTPHAAFPVRLRVSNMFKTWLESHWRHDRDSEALPFIADFAESKLRYHLPTAARHLSELASKVALAKNPVVPRLVSSMGRTNTAMVQFASPDMPLPAPNVGKREINLLRLWKSGGDAKPSILDFDALELARQLTVKASRIFCSILPEELLASEWMKKDNSLALNVRAMSTLSTDLAHFVADSILELEEPKRRAATVKQWIKIAGRCLELNNYDTLMAVICSLNSSTIARLKRTWELVPQRHRTTLEHLRHIVDVSRNYAVLRQRLQNHVPPCLPFVGTYLTDLTFVDHGNQAVRALCQGAGQMEVINFDKHMKTARIIGEFQRFQIPYRLAEVPELQTWLQSELVRVRSSSEMQKFYRRSLVLEPRKPPPVPPAESVPRVDHHVAQRFDFLAWTYPKAKSIVSNLGEKENKKEAGQK